MLRSFLRDWGIELLYIISGLIGSVFFVIKKKNRKRPKWEKFIIILTGIVAANYLSPLIIWYLHIPKDAHGGIAFLVGYIGLESIGILIDNLRKKYTKEK